MSNLVCDNVAKLNVLVQQAVRPLAKQIYLLKAFKKRRKELLCFMECSILIIMLINITNFPFYIIYNNNVILFIYNIYYVYM